jgi:hypothetical protein
MARADQVVLEFAHLDPALDEKCRPMGFLW